MRNQAERKIDDTEAQMAEQNTHSTVVVGAEPRTITDFGWTPEQARDIRARLASFCEDWDDPVMDVYDSL